MTHVVSIHFKKWVFSNIFLGLSELNLQLLYLSNYKPNITSVGTSMKRCEMIHINSRLTITQCKNIIVKNDVYYITTTRKGL